MPRGACLARLTLCIPAAIAAAGLAACGSSDTTNSTASSSTGSSRPAYKLALLDGYRGAPFFVSMECGAKAEAEKLGATINMQSSTEYSPAAQTPLLNALLATKPDGLIFAPTDSKALIPQTKAAVDSGVTVVMADSTIADPTLYKSFVASNNVEGGRKAAAEAIKLTGGHGSALVLATAPGITPQDQRIQGFKEGLAGSDMKLAGVEYEKTGDLAASASVIKAALTKNPDVTAIFGVNSQVAGAAQAVKESGKSDTVKLVGFDADPTLVSLLKRGEIQAIVTQQPGEIGADAVEQLVNSLAGKPVQKSVEPPLTVITQDNIDTPEAKAGMYQTKC
jgi:ribose transport system substrate-binding protein